jgi:hypothetical protein
MRIFVNLRSQILWSLQGNGGSKHHTYKRQSATFPVYSRTIKSVYVFLSYHSITVSADRILKIIKRGFHSFSSLSHYRFKPLPKRAVHRVLSRASSFRCEYPLLSLWSASSFLRLLPRLPVAYIKTGLYDWKIWNHVVDHEHWKFSISRIS